MSEGSPLKGIAMTILGLLIGIVGMTGTYTTRLDS